jgi:hypothetical protein
LRILPAERGSALPMLALALWAALLLAGGYVEARYQLVRNQVERVAAEADLLRTGIETFLSAGLPLGDFLGFGPLGAAAFAADPALERIVVLDALGAAQFAAPNGGGDDWRPVEVFAPLPRLPGEPRWTPGAGLALTADAADFRVTLPLRNRFETVGQVALSTPRDLAHRELAPVGAVVAALLVLLALLYYPLARARIGRGDAPRAGELNSNFVALALVMTAVWLGALYWIYAESMREKAEVLARSLGERLGQSVDLGLDLNSFEGIDRLFQEYRRSNPDVGFVTLVVGNIVTLATGEGEERGRWRQPDDSLTATVEVQPRRVFSSQVRVALGIEKQLVYREVLYSAVRLALGAAVLAAAWLALLNLALARRGRAGAATAA